MTAVIDNAINEANRATDVILEGKIFNEEFIRCRDKLIEVTIKNALNEAGDEEGQQSWWNDYSSYMIRHGELIAEATILAAKSNGGTGKRLTVAHLQAGADFVITQARLVCVDAGASRTGCSGYANRDSIQPDVLNF